MKEENKDLIIPTGIEGMRKMSENKEESTSSSAPVLIKGGVRQGKVIIVGDGSVGRTALEVALGESNRHHVLWDDIPSVEPTLEDRVPWVCPTYKSVR